VLHFRARGTGGFHPQIARDARAVGARKRETDVQVHFATDPTAVRTQEGVVQAHTGDAIVTGAGGAQWPVSRRGFAGKYRQLSADDGGDGKTYRSVPHDVMALRMEEPFSVLLADGVSVLHGTPGDWLVDHGDGSLGVVSSDAFAATYDVLT